MTKTALELLIEIQGDLAELRRLANDLPPAHARVVLMFADRMELQARAIDAGVVSPPLADHNMRWGFF
ncbi:hypothetical protein [Bradyrhizobium sp. Gha]|uniref:hypothetical protein n=1 Tax=Bradyrhizobium sp. Gha TaxID=1855318 RepID=UPI000B8649A4|nr:hypothetical protein [Bradyrhizobium sp. Gha]